MKTTIKIKPGSVDMETNKKDVEAIIRSLDPEHDEEMIADNIINHPDENP